MSLSAPVMESPNVKKTNALSTSKQKAFFEEQGYLVVEEAVAEEEIELLRRELLTICKGELGAIPSRASDSSQGIREENKSLTDEEILKRYLCIHFPHKISDVYLRALAFRKVVQALTTVIGPNVKCMQSMLFVKASGKPGHYIPTRDRSLTGAWIAMDDAHVENGCLWVIPGSHRAGILWPMRQHNDLKFDCAQEAYSYPYSDADSIPVEVKKGAVVLFNGYLLHRSLPNKAKSGFRRSLVNHYMSAESLLPWGEKARDYRDIVMVAGRDPYAYKGVENTAKAHIRPSGEGGCGNAEHNIAQKL